ncbi:MAG: nitrite reductase small subunit NirD [Planctomycetota bacterium]
MSKPKGESRGLGFLQRVRPDAVTHLLAFFRESANHLDSKTRFLISIVTKVIGNSPRGLQQYVKRALKEGATADEIIDAILCAYPCAGLTKVVDSLDVVLDMGLPEFEEAKLTAATGDEEPAAAPTPSDPLTQRVTEETPSGWYEAGTLDELSDGRRIRVLAGEHDVAVFEVDGDVRAIGNRCPHAGAPLSEGYVQGEHVVCPLHAWRFDLKTGGCPDVPNVSVPSYDVKVEGDKVLLRFS